MITRLASRCSRIFRAIALGESMPRLIYIAIACCLALPLCSNADDGAYFPTAVAQTQTGDYTRYELLAPETASFKIYYEVAATTAGARYFYNPIRNGSTASDESVYDAMLGTALPFEVVSGSQAHLDPLMPDAERRCATSK